MNRRTSNIWHYCQVLDKTHAKCGLCKQRLSYKSSITNIKRHLARKHPEVCQVVSTSPRPEYQVAETIEIKPLPSDSEATYEICEDETPRSTNDNNLNVTTQILASSCGSFHIIPKVITEVKNDEVENEITEVSVINNNREFRKQKTSDIWQHCTVIDRVYAKCNICEAVLSYKTSITNIKKHLARKHNFEYPTSHLSKLLRKKPTVVCDSKDEQPSTSQTQVDTKHKKMETKKEPPTFLHTYSRKKDPASLSLKNRLDNKLLDLFIKDYQSFRIVEEVGFRSFVRSLNTSYVIPSRQQIVKSLSTTYGKCLMEMKELAQDIKECCLTTDYWTSESNDSFLAVTVHFIDEEFTMKSILLECISVHATTSIARELQRITEEWGVDRKILLAVSDNDVSVEAAMTELKWNHFGCFANTINCLVQEVLTTVDCLLEKVKSVVFHFRSNVEANAKLEMYQRNANASVKPKKLIQEDGRWISSLRMLERFVELEEALKEVSLLYQDTNLPQITYDEWRVVHELCQMLKPFETVANFISSERYTSASLVIVLTKELDDALEEMLVNDFCPIINEMLTKLKTGLEQQLGNVEISETLALCTYLDPRFKNLGFSSGEAADATKEHLIELLSSKISEQTISITATPTKTVSQNQFSFSIWQSFKKRVSECKQPGTSKSRAIIEVERYLEDELMDQQKNPLEWWREYKSIYPCMSVVAQEVMCALGTSVPSDRIFSKNGCALNMRRNCLNNEEMKILTFLNSNSDLCRKKTFDV